MISWSRSCCGVAWISWGSLKSIFHLEMFFSYLSSDLLYVQAFKLQTKVEINFQIKSTFRRFYCWEYLVHYTFYIWKLQVLHVILVDGYNYTYICGLFLLSLGCIIYVQYTIALYSIWLACFELYLDGGFVHMSMSI